ncbi:LysR family transcriptional regulator [Patescibacteria group bacterium]
MLNSIRDFHKVVDIGNLTKAAKELFITQPALSISIKNLEKQLGCKLLTRGKNGVKPTKLGKVVYKFSKEIDIDFKNLKRRISESNRKSSKNICMGMIDNVGLVFVSKVYKEFHKNHLKVNLQIQVDNSYRLIEKVEKGKIDFAIITKGDQKLSNKFFINDFGEEEMVLVASPKVAEGIKNIKSLNNMNFISYNKESSTHKIIKNTLEENDLSINFISHSSSPKFIVEMIKEGVGIAFLPENYVQKDILTEELKRIRIRSLNFTRQFQLIYLRSTFLTKTTQEFIERIREVF